jgi:putative phosphotransacetylase
METKLFEKDVIRKTFKEANRMRVPLGVSNRHIHLSKEHLGQLFGTDYELMVLKDLSQPGQFAARETVEIIGPRGSIERVRILGPCRKQTQLEISKTDGFALGLQAPVRDSGELDRTPGIRIKGPAGEVKTDSGVIIAARHIHFHTTDADKYGIRDKDVLKVKVVGERGLIFENVVARVHHAYALEMHIDTDEANAAGLKNKDTIEVLDVKRRQFVHL